MAVLFYLVNKESEMMKEKNWKGPGIFEGFSTNKAYKGKYITVQIDNESLIEIDLETPWPTDQDPLGIKDEPGILANEFFKRNLCIKYPEEAEDDLIPFVLPSY